jgi:hypothetical protein
LAVRRESKKDYRVIVLIGHQSLTRPPYLSEPVNKRPKVVREIRLRATVVVPRESERVILYIKKRGDMGGIAGEIKGADEAI